jgi:hypothetical protein
LYLDQCLGPNQKKKQYNTDGARYLGQGASWWNRSTLHINPGVTSQAIKEELIFQGKRRRALASGKKR